MDAAWNAPGATVHEGRSSRAERITRVETIPLRLPLRSAFEIATGGKRVSLDVLLVRVHTDAGVAGVGETQAWRRLGSSETLRGLVAAVEEILAPVLVGRSAFAAPALLRSMDAALYGVLYAKAAVADALLDLQGRLLGRPASCLLGGQARDRVDVCAVLPIAPEPSRTVEAALAGIEQGFRSFVIKVGAAGADVKLVRALRKALPDAALRLDANASLDWSAARSMADALADCDLEGFEQPLPPSDVDGLAALARVSRIPLIADESVSTAHDVLRVVNARAAQGIQTKVAKNGGAWRTRELWTIAATAGLRIYPGNHPSTSIAVASVAQLAASWPGDLCDGPFAVGVIGGLVEDVVTEPVVVRGNQVMVPGGHGLGVELNEDVVNHFRVDR